jgi:hypothetical protein
MPIDERWRKEAPGWLKSLWEKEKDAARAMDDQRRFAWYEAERLRILSKLDTTTSPSDGG